MTTTDGRRPRGSLEAEVLAVLRARDEPAGTAEVQRALGGDLAYNTVQTVLTRLHEKGHVRRRRAGRGHVYWPLEDAATAAAAQMRAALNGRSDRRAVLRHFAASLDESDAAELRRMLAEADPDRP